MKRFFTLILGALAAAGLFIGLWYTVLMVAHVSQPAASNVYGPTKYSSSGVPLWTRWRQRCLGGHGVRGPWNSGPRVRPNDAQGGNSRTAGGKFRILQEFHKRGHDCHSVVIK